ncbi:MAG: tetratricopeptide repeat protein, partial [Chitinivibrionales bacterium]|nr:tetratricopeptide repeat protein [Chitinivibrionales bacterium]
MDFRRTGTRVVGMCGLFAGALIFSDASALSAAGGGKESVQKISVLVAPPVNADGNNTKSTWFSALSDEMIAFRFAALDKFERIPFDQFAANCNITANTLDCNDPAVLKTLVKYGVDYVISSKYEITNFGKKVVYYSEFYSVDKKTTSAIIEKKFKIEETGSELDSCAARFLALCGVQLTPDQQHFFDIAAISENVKSLKETGKLLAAERNNAIPPEKCESELEKITGTDSRMLIAFNHGAGIALKSEQYEKANAIYKNIFNIIPNYAPLYAALARTSRLSLNLNNALYYAELGEKKGIITPELLLEKAFTLAAMGDSTQAATAYRQILGLNPDEPHALLFLAQRGNAQGKAAAALALAERLLKREAKNGLAYLEKGKSLFALGKSAEAAEVFLHTVTLLPSNPEAHSFLGDYYSEQGDYKTAATHYKKAIPALSDNVELNMKAAQACEMAQDLQCALMILRRFDIPPFAGNNLIQRKLGMLEYALRDTQNALRYLTVSVKLDKTDDEALMILGGLYAGKNDADKAIDMYVRALAIIKNKAACQLALAKLYILKNRPSEALALLRNLIDGNPRYAEANRYLGDVFMMLGDDSKALQSYLAERQYHGETVLLQQRIAQLFYATAAWEKAQEEYGKLLAMKGMNAPDFYKLAVVKLYLGRVAEAPELIARAQAGGAPDAGLAFELAVAFDQAGQTLRAVDWLNVCLQQAPGNEDALLRLSRDFGALKKDSASAETMLKLFALNNNKYSVLLARAGHLFLGCGSKDRARKAYQTFLEKKYVDREVTCNLAQIEFGGARFEQVIALLEPLAADAALAESYRMMLAECFAAKEQFVKVLPVVNAVLAQNANQLRALQLAALASEKTNALGDAIRFSARYCELAPLAVRADCAFHLGELYENVDSLDNAIERYTLNVSQFPNDVRSFKRLIELYMEASEFAQAQT